MGRFFSWVRFVISKVPVDFFAISLAALAWVFVWPSPIETGIEVSCMILLRIWIAFLIFSHSKNASSIE